MLGGGRKSTPPQKDGRWLGWGNCLIENIQLPDGSHGVASPLAFQNIMQCSGS